MASSHILLLTVVNCGRLIERKSGAILLGHGLASLKYPATIAAAPVVSITKFPVPAVPLLNQSSFPLCTNPLKKFARRSASTPNAALMIGVVICAEQKNENNTTPKESKNRFISIDLITKSFALEGRKKGWIGGF